MEDGRTRCRWCMSTPEMIRYHDEEWGTPLHDDGKQFEFLMLEAMQCGLSWGLMMKKREVFRACFDGFDFEKIALYGEADVRRILDDPQMIHSEAKIRAVIRNAKAFLKIREEYGSFDAWLWGFCGGKTIVYDGHPAGEMPAANGLSGRISRELKKRGFSYLGPVTVYSHLQACGMICDHTEDCFRFAEIRAGGNMMRMAKDEEK